MGTIIFNGKSSEDFHILVEHPPGYEFPQKDYSVVHVPGRNGDLISFNGSYRNVPRKYEIAIVAENDEFSRYAGQIVNWLHSGEGYSRLEDSYEPDYFRLAYYEENNTVENILNGAGRAIVKFICKPQRFLKSGEQSKLFTAGTTILNPTSNITKPLLKVYGTDGTVTIGSVTFSLTGVSSYIYVDCDIEDAYKDGQNENSKMTGQFPYFSKGANSVSWTGNITGIEITPRWWTI